MYNLVEVIIMRRIQIKNGYQVVAIALFVVGLFFSYFIAELDDAPGFIIFGTAVTTTFCMLLFGLGDLININNKNNKILDDLYQGLKKNK